MQQTVVITGANRGIGLALTERYMADGAEVFAVCRQSSKQLDSLEAKVIDSVDVQTTSGLETLKKLLDGQSIDVLINNAGILRDEQLGNIDPQSIVEQFNINALAPLRIVDHLRHQLVSGSKVAMITSRMGSIADNTSGGRYGYRMSKAALNAASVSLSHDLEQFNISVGIYHPGYVQTDMVGGRGDISAQESASRIHALVQKQSMQNTGVFWHSNGQKLPW